MITSSLATLARLFWLAGAAACLPAAAQAHTVIVVTGAAGEAGYAGQFATQAKAWQAAAERAGAKHMSIGLGAEDPEGDAATLREALAAEKPDGHDPLWLVFNGHGTWDGKTARFNLRGPDITAADLAAWLKPITRPAAVIHAHSASAPFLNALAAPGRCVITATRSGSEQNLSRFGQHLAAALADPAADSDADGAASLLEVFLLGARKTAESYKTTGQLATEHALIDDNGDGLGTPAEWFRGLRAVKKAGNAAPPDGAAARYTFLAPPPDAKPWPEPAAKQREALEAQLAAWREKKASLKEEEYLAGLEKLLVPLARLAAEAEK